MAVWLEPLIKSLFLLLSASDYFPIKRRARQGSNAGLTTLDQAWYGGSLDQMARYGFSIKADQARTGFEACDVYFSDKSPLLYRYAMSITAIPNHALITTVGNFLKYMMVRR